MTFLIEGKAGLRRDAAVRSQVIGDADRAHLRAGKIRTVFCKRRDVGCRLAPQVVVRVECKTAGRARLASCQTSRPRGSHHFEQANSHCGRRYLCRTSPTLLLRRSVGAETLCLGFNPECTRANLRWIGNVAPYAQALVMPDSCIIPRCRLLFSS
jgi:hypothetical protein